ncbi:hypothetical protein B0H14DRAFT_2578458 [Mycena olivaceomarginata]|nr:hypothetical protein B0H14DRAFT_2578458 [Mycena olivaceomarginata]
MHKSLSTLLVCLLSFGQLLLRILGPAALPDLPTTQAAADLDDPLDIDNIQANAKLASNILPLITSTTEILSVNTQPVTAVNNGFSHTGLVTLGVTEIVFFFFLPDLGDTDFVAGQFSETSTIGDNPSLRDPVFAGTSIHGVILLASDTIDNINTELANIQSILGTSITELWVTFQKLVSIH